MGSFVRKGGGKQKRLESATCLGWACIQGRGHPRFYPGHAEQEPHQIC